MWLVRHGESTWNARQLVQGQATGPVLTARGRQQAASAARLLKCAASPGGAVAVVSSDLERAVETAAPIAAALELPLQVDPRLRERALGAAEGRPVASLDPDRSGVRAGRVVDADAAPDGGESIRQFHARVTGCLADLADLADLGEQVLVTHGGVVRVFRAWSGGFGPDDMAWADVPNGGVVWRAIPVRPGLVPAPSGELGARRAARQPSTVARRLEVQR